MCGGSALSPFQRKLMPIIKKLEDVQHYYNDQAGVHDKDARKQITSAKTAMERDDGVGARVAALEYIRKLRFRDRALLRAGEVHQLIRKLDAIHADYALVQQSEDIIDSIGADMPEGSRSSAELEQRLVASVTTMDDDTRGILQSDSREDTMTEADSLLRLWHAGQTDVDIGVITGSAKPPGRSMQDDDDY